MLSLMQVIEIIAVFFSLIFLILVIQRKIWCWLFGILSSVLSIFLFLDAKLYSEAILYLFYVIIGFYGWYQWYVQNNSGDSAIKQWKWTTHIIIIGAGIFGSAVMGYFFSRHTDADKPYADATSTIFSFLASYMEAHRILSTWFFWIIINGFSVWLYAVKGLSIYASLMVLYCIMSFVGLWQWHKSYRMQT